MVHSILLIAWFAIPLLVWATLLCVRRKIHPALICAICFAAMIVGTIVLANYVWALDAFLLAEVDKYDPNSPEAQRASEEWASDTGRSFALLFSPVITGFLYSGVFLALFGGQWLITQIIPGRPTAFSKDNTGDESRNSPNPDNPYHPPAKG